MIFSILKNQFSIFEFNNIYSQMNLSSFVILSIAISLTFSQNTTLISLNEDYQVTLIAEKPYFFQVILPSDLSANKDFYFIVQWPTTDPLQDPFIDIYVKGGYYWSCYNSNNEFSGVCSIPASSLSANGSVISEIYCFVDCNLKINPILSSKFKMSLKDTNYFTASQKDEMPVEIEIQVPFDLKYTQIAIYAQIDSIEKANEGLEMYANVGNYSRSIPTKGQFDISGESIYWGGKGIFLSKQIIKPGQWIKLYLLLSKGMKIKLFSNILNGNNYYIQLGKSYFDFTNLNEQKLYILDLSKSGSKIQGKTVLIGFIVYSGNPYVKISMDSNFTTIINERSSISTSNYIITQSIRNQSNFNGIIYIKVLSYWNSDYLLYTQVDSENYMTLFPDISFYNQLEPNQLFNYFFDDLIFKVPNQTYMRSYSIRVDMLKGRTTFGVRRCKSIQAGQSLLACLLNSTSDIKNTTILSTFQDIELSINKNDIYYYLKFDLNVSQCAFANTSTAYYCSFHIVAIEDSKNGADFTITLNNRQYSSTLREGQLTRQLIFKDEYLYFRYGITSLADIVSITFYITVIEGDVYLLGSNIDEFPTSSSKTQNLVFSIGNFLTFDRDRLAKTIYISVYGIELSQFTLGVKVIRKSQSNNSTNTTQSQTELTLKLDLSQQFVFQEAQTYAIFLLTTPNDLNITTEVMLLAGTVSLQIRNSKNEQIPCQEGNSSTNNKISCSFQATGLAVYKALITGKKGQIQKFIIMYHKQDTCFSYSLNLPLYLDLSAGQTSCVLFTLSKLNEIEVTTSAPLSSLLDQSLSMTVCLNDKCLDQTASHHKLISKNELIPFCKFQKLNNSNIFESCIIKILTVANTSTSFSIIVEQIGRDIGLFDGIVEKVNSYGLTHESGKYFYYQIYNWDGIKIFFTSLSYNSYYIALHFVQQTLFLKNSSQIYLPFRQTNYNLNKKFQTNFYQTIVYGSYTNIFTISSSIIDKYCDQCVLTLSVYPLYTDSHSLSYFQIEVTQTETMLFLGNSKIGYLQTDQIYSYQLESSLASDALVTIKDLSKQSDLQTSCFSASLVSGGSDYPQKIDNGMGYIKKGSSSSILYVQSMLEYCNYEVTYTRIDFPLIIATKNRKYSFQQSKSGKLFMLYTHSSTKSFKVIQIINTGNINIYANSINNKTITSLISADLKTYDYIDSDSNGQFIILNTSKQFCSNCQYIIAVESVSAASLQILIADYNSSVPLSINGIIKQKIVKAELAYRNYTFNSISAFNLTITIIYGKISIEIFNPSKKSIISLNITNSETISIPHNKDTQYYSYDYNSYYTQYYINVQAAIDSSFTIKASKEKLTSRIFEGIPFYYYFNPNQTINLEFLNLNAATQTSKSLNILVDLEFLSQKNSTPLLVVSALFHSKQGEKPSDLSVTSLTLSETVYNIELPLKKGTYYIRMISDLKVSTSITLVKQSLIHLSPSSDVVLFKQAYFQLYSYDQAAMIEIFTCYGDLSIDASSNYNDLYDGQTSSSQITLQQSNYGGHYVIYANSIFGQYFMKVSSRHKKISDIGYSISYHYYDIDDIPPYKIIDLVDREIIYRLNSTTITFIFDQISINWDISDSIDSVYVQYRLYIGKNKTKVSQYSNCRLGKEYISIIQADYQDIKQQTQTVEISIDLKQIDDIVGNQQIYYVSAESRTYIDPSEQADDDYPVQLKLIYDTIQLNNIKVPIDVQSQTTYSPQTIILWFLLPFAIAAVVLYFALKYFIKKYQGLIPNNELVEEDNGFSEQKFQNSVPIQSNSQKIRKDEID